MKKNNQINSYIEALKEEILAFFSINQGQAFSMNQLFKHYDVNQHREKTLYGLLVSELVAETKLYELADGKISLNSEQNAVVGVLDHVNPRFGFVRHDSEKSDIWVSTDDLAGAIDGDTVKVSLYGSFYKKGANPEGKVIEIIKRGRSEIVGKLQNFGNYALVTPDGKRIHDDIFVAKQHINGAKKNDKVIVKILAYGDRFKQISGDVVEILGKSGENNAEMHAIMAEFGLPVRFPEEVEQEAISISEVISAEEVAKRRDFRNILTFTIDPLDAQDFDDALSVQQLPNGNWEIGVHIADVTHYVRPDTALESEAFRRATSVYLVDRCVPMLPEKLSNRLCSLRPNEEKLTFSAVFEMNEKSQIVSEWFGRTVIYSDRRFTYEEAQEYLNLDHSPEDKGEIEALHLLNKLAKILKGERFEKGAINFETAEVKFQLDAEGKPLGVYTKIRQDAHKLIEEFMLLANRRVAEFVFRQNNANTMVYRVHDAPNPDKLINFAKFANRLGYKLNLGGDVAHSLNRFMNELEGKPEQHTLESLAVRAMAKAIYTTDARGHYGLAFGHYSHFTSPIRRYPDMMTHRLLALSLENQNTKDSKFGGVSTEEACKHSSEREKMAAEAERASIKYKQVEYMSLQARQTFSGVVTGVTDFGVFVEMAGTACEGLVRMTDLKDDWYELDQENYRVVGRKTGKIIHFGDVLEVRVKATDLEKRSIDLEPVGMNKAKTDHKPARKKENYRRKR